MSADEAASLIAGTIYAHRYEIVRRLGEGACGAVDEARMRPLLRRVALTMLHPALSRGGFTVPAP